MKIKGSDMQVIVRRNKSSGKLFSFNAFWSDQCECEHRTYVGTSENVSISFIIIFFFRFFFSFFISSDSEMKNYFKGELWV